MRSTLVAAVGVGLILSACAPAGQASSTPDESSTPTAEATRSPFPTATQSPTPVPTTTQPTLAIDDFAEVVTTHLVVRSAPGTGEDSDILGTVANLPVTVLGGPVHADGYEWWLIRPIDSDGFEPPPSGWVAAGGQGEVWLAPASLPCEDAPTSEALWGMPTAMWVGCYSGVELTLRGTLWHCSEAADGMGWWALGCAVRNCTPDMCEGLFDDRPVSVHMDPLPALPDLGGRIRVTGHFDDPAAHLCRVDGNPLSPVAVFQCRTHFVATSYEFAD